MKKITLLACTLIASATFAQLKLQPSTGLNASKMNQGKTPLAGGLESVRFIGGGTKNSTQAVVETYLDYGGLEQAVNGDAPASPTPGTGYRQFITDMNNAYIYNPNTIDSLYEFSLKSVIATFDSLVDDQGTYFAPNTVTSVRIDTIFMLGGYERNTSSKDSLYFDVMNVTGPTNYPGNTVYNTTFQDIDTLPGTGSQFNSWLFRRVFFTAPNYTLPTGVNKFSIRARYRGNKLDTLGFLYGFIDAGGPCGQAHYKPAKSVFRNTFVNTGAYGVVPQTNGADFYTPCDGNGTVDPTDGESSFQLARIIVKVTINTNVGINESSMGKLKVRQNAPNPFNDFTTVSYELAENAAVSMDVFDISGKKIQTVEEGKKSAGNHTLQFNSANLQAGVYFYTLNAGENRVTKRMTIVK